MGLTRFCCSSSFLSYSTKTLIPRWKSITNGHNTKFRFRNFRIELSIAFPFLAASVALFCVFVLAMLRAIECNWGRHNCVAFYFWPKWPPHGFLINAIHHRLFIVCSERWIFLPLCELTCSFPFHSRILSNSTINNKLRFPFRRRGLWLRHHHEDKLMPRATKRMWLEERAIFCQLSNIVDRYRAEASREKAKVRRFQ